MKDEIIKAGCGAISAGELILYLYGEIHDARVDDHIAGCAACRAEVEELRAARDAARQSVDLPGEGAVLRVKQAARARSWRPPRAWMALAASLLMAAAIFLARKTEETSLPAPDNRDYLAAIDGDLDEIETKVAEDDSIAGLLDWFEDDSVEDLEVAASGIERDMDIGEGEIQSTDR